MVKASWHSLERQGAAVNVHTHQHQRAARLSRVCVCVCVKACSCQQRPDDFSSLLRGQVIDSHVIDLHELVSRDEPTICRTAWTHKRLLFPL